MVKFIRRHLETFVVAFVVASVAAGAPAIAAIVKHARYADRAGVAKNARHLGGKLPSAYLLATAKAADSDLLDGMNSTDFAPAGQSSTGTYALIDHDGGGTGADPQVVQGQGVSGVTRAAAGIYCLAVSGTPPTGAVGVATIDSKLSETSGDGGSVGIVYVDSDAAGAGCQAGEFAVRTYTVTSSLPDPVLSASDDLAFSFTLT